MQGMGWTLALAAAVLPAGLAAQAVEATDQNDRAAHAFLSAVDLGEVQQSMLAMERATNAEVRAYAQQMINDHHNALHTREMLMQTERSGLMPAMNHGSQGGAHAGHGNAAAAGQASGGQGGAHAGHGNAAAGQASGGQGGAHAGHGNAAAGQASGQGQSGAHAGHGNAAAGQASGGQGQAGAHAGHGNAAGGQASGGHGGAHAGHGAMAGGAPMPTPEMIAQVETVLRNHPMSRPVVEANARNLAVLQGVTGPQFDPTYMDAQIAAHRYALQNIDRLLAQQNTLGDDIRGTLRMMRTAVAAHLQTAEQIRARLQ
jgi:predicted outer membrane protein